MSEWIAEVVIAGLALLGTLGGSWMANRRSSALIVYRLEQLEHKVDKHNQVIERTYKLEEEYSVLEERMKAVDRRIDDVAYGE